MKYFFLLSLILIVKTSFSQTGMVFLTEEFTTSPPFSSKVHVTLPDGNSSTTIITPEADNVAKHDVELNIIINGLIKQGYKIIPQPDGWTGGFMNSSNKMVFQRRLFFVNSQ